MGQGFSTVPRSGSKSKAVEAFPLSLPLDCWVFPAGSHTGDLFEGRRAPMAMHCPGTPWVLLKFGHRHLLEVPLFQPAAWRPARKPMRSWLLPPDHPRKKKKAACFDADPRPLRFTHGRGVMNNFQDKQPNAADGAGGMSWFASYFGRSFLQVFCLWQRRWLLSCRVGRTARPEAYFGIYPFSWLPAGRPTSRALPSRGPTPSADRPSGLERLVFVRSKSFLLGWIRELGGDRLPWPGSFPPTTTPRSTATSQDLW